MPLLIKGRAIIEDRWTLLRDARSLADIPGETAVIVPLALWKSEHETLVMRQDVGVWLKPDDDPGAASVDFEDFADVMDGQLVFVHVVHDDGIRLFQILNASLHQVPRPLHDGVRVQADNLDGLFASVSTLPLRPTAYYFLRFFHSGHSAHLI